MTKRTEQERIARGAHAQGLANDALLNEILQGMEDKFLASIANSSPNQANEREIAYTMVYGIKRFRAELRALMNDAVMAKETMKSRGE